MIDGIECFFDIKRSETYYVSISKSVIQYLKPVEACCELQ